MIDIVTGKVATILSDREIALNVGTNHGVSLDDVVTLTELVDVKDPDTKESLGSVRLVKLRLRISMATERYSVATVTDRVTNTSPNQSRWVAAPFKAITNLPSQVSGQAGYVTVGVGEEARVSRADEPPF